LDALQEREEERQNWLEELEVRVKRVGSQAVIKPPRVPSTFTETREEDR
jgi:hypothetical protein